LAVAQQTGSAHEDETVEVALVQLEQFLIGGFSGYAGPMSGAAEHALREGGRLYDTPLKLEPMRLVTATSSLISRSA